MHPTFEVVVELSACSLALRNYVQGLFEHCEKLEEQVQKLAARVNQTSENSHRPPSSEPFVKPKSLRQKTGRKPGGQIGHPGETLLRERHPDRTITLEADYCPDCGFDLSTVPAHDHVKRQTQDVDIRRVSTDYFAQKKICPNCHRPVTAKFPEEVSHYIQYGPTISAIMVYLNQGNNIPFDRLAKVSRDVFNTPLSQGTLVNMVEECGMSLETSMSYIKAKLLAAPVINADETGIRVKGSLRWLHSVSNASYTYLETHPKRGNKATEQINLLPNYHGILIHDFWKSYFAYEKCQHALCNAHILRELTGIVDNFHLQWASDMKALLLELYAQVMAEGGFLVGHPLTAFKVRYDNILADGRLEDPVEISENPSTKRGRVPKTKAQNLWERMAHYKEDILRFAADWEIPFDNNLAERDIRMAKIFGKISGGFRSEDGNIHYGRIRSYLSTANKQGYSMFDALYMAARKVPLFNPAQQ